MARNGEIVTLIYDHLVDDRETDLAWCVVFSGETVFLPKSQVEDIRETSNEIDVPLWLVELKELEGYIK